MSDAFTPKQLTTSRVRGVLRDCTEERRNEVYTRLKELGADYYDMLLPETHVLPRMLAPDERVEGIVYGKYLIDRGTHVSRGLLAITDQRVLLVDKKPMFLHYNDINFEVISGVMYGQWGLSEVVTLNTRMGQIEVRTYNKTCASQFVNAVEDMLFLSSKERTL